MAPRDMFRLFQMYINESMKAGESMDSATQKMEDVAKYCMIGCVLTLDLVVKVKMIYALYGLSSVTLTNVQKYILTGEQRKSYNLICRKATEMGSMRWTQTECARINFNIVCVHFRLSGGR